VLDRPGVALGRVVGILTGVAPRAALAHEVPQAVELHAHLLEARVLVGREPAPRPPAIEEAGLLGPEALDGVGGGPVCLGHGGTVRLRRAIIYRPACMAIPSAEQRTAVIDLGSNSFRLVVFTAAEGWWKRTDEIYEAVRIGAGLGETGELGEEPMQRALH